MTQKCLYLLVDFNADGALGDIPDPTRTTMVKLVWHTFMDRPVNFDVHILSDFVGTKICGEVGRTLLSECSGKGIPSSRSQSVPSRHFRVDAAKLGLALGAREDGRDIKRSTSFGVGLEQSYICQGMGHNWAFSFRLNFRPQ